MQSPFAFWPAQGQCRFLEQEARIEFEFGSPADGARVSIVRFEALAALAPDGQAIPLADAPFVSTSARDLRPRPVPEGMPVGETPPRALSIPRVRIPDELRHSQGLGGYVFLAFEVTANGRPRDIKAHDTWAQVAGKEKHLAIEAVRAMRDVEFQPALRDGVAVAHRSCYLVTFTITAWAD